AIARRIAHSPAGAFAFEHARLFDTEHGAALSGRTVVIQGHRIAAVGEDGRVAIPAGAEVIDATGRTLLPGLWDMHVHLSPSDGLMHMACGVTSVRDMGNDIDILARIRKQWDAGTEVGPRVIPAGLIDGRGPFQGPTKVLADSLPEAMAAVDRYADLGYAQIKIYSSVHPELVPAIAAEAHRRGLRVSGHVPAFMTAEQFIRAGVDEIQHMNFIFLNFMADSILDTRSTARFTFPARLSAGLDLHSARVQQFIQLMHDRRIVLDPTLGVFEGLFTDRPGEISHTIGITGDRLPIQVRRGFTTGGLAVPPGMDARYRDSFQRMLEMTKALHEGGVTIVAGTDGMAGFMLHRELELYVRAGLTPAEVLQIATLSAARVMKRDADLGSIAPGKLADVILVDGNPDQRIEDIRKVELVMKDGTLYRTRDLDEALGVRPLPAMAAETPPR
ncbi:MAG TPA: amidohydrolase family protein, partial [Candidatus Udaeobacter sp.]|nr:amidohydrolase family protein [Candidatus Udaeobacter sp.]